RLSGTGGSPPILTHRPRPSPGRHRRNPAAEAPGRRSPPATPPPPRPCRFPSARGPRAREGVRSTRRHPVGCAFGHGGKNPVPLGREEPAPRPTPRRPLRRAPPRDRRRFVPPRVVVTPAPRVDHRSDFTVQACTPP